MQRIQVGNVEMVALSDCEATYPASSVYPGAGSEQLAPYSRHMTADGGLTMNFGCYLLRADGATVLVDAGYGPEQDGRLMRELADAGVARDEIGIVIFTHLHGDHTGWNIDRERGEPNFPNARYLVPRKDWDHYRAQNPPSRSFARDIVPLETLGKLELIEPEHRLTDSLLAVPSPGHTPGHLSVAIDSGGQRGMVIGDVVISPVDVEEPDLDISFDWDHAIARQTRRAMLDRLGDGTALVAASHLPAPGLGRFVPLEGKRTWRAIG